MNSYFKPLEAYIPTAQQQQQQAIVDALRNLGGAGFIPQQQAQQAQTGQQQQVTPAVSQNTANGLGQLVGMGIGKGANYLSDQIGTAMKYDTNPFSQQTSMLAAQDAAFR